MRTQCTCLPGDDSPLCVDCEQRYKIDHLESILVQLLDHYDSSELHSIITIASIHGYDFSKKYSERGKALFLQAKRILEGKE